MENNAKVICADETTLKVLNSNKLISYIRVYISTFYDHPIYIYEHCNTRERKQVSNFLKNYKGYLLTHAYSGYANQEGIINAYCWAHARRKLAEIIKSLSSEQLKISKAREIKDLIDKLFEKERKFKINKYDPEK